MEFIDFYEINAAALDCREECLDCEFRGSECGKLTNKKEDWKQCPFSEVVAFELQGIFVGLNDGLLVDLADELMELDLNEEDAESLKVSHFRLFLIDNFALLEDRIKDFFVNRVRDTDNYKDVMSEVKFKGNAMKVFKKH